MAKVQVKENAKPKYSAAYWATEISNRKNDHKKFWDEAKESIKVYNTRHNIGQVERKLNVWWYIVNTLMPAYYSSTPKAEVDLRKYAGRQVFDLAAVLLERSTQTSMDCDFDFDFVGYNSALQFSLTGRGVLWAHYEASFGKEEEFEIFSSESGLVDMYGNPFEGQEDRIAEKEGRLFYVESPVDGEKAILELVQYDNYLNSDARNEEEVEWRSKCAYLSREKATEIFGADSANKLTYDCYSETSKEDYKRGKERTQREGKAQLWEIWSEEQDKTYFIQASGDKSFIESEKPQINYPGFYPCVVINASIDPESTIPTSDYTHAKDQILEVERLTSRMHAMVQAIRSSGAYDATLGNTIEDILKTDLRLIPVKSWPAYKAKGGLSQGIEMLQIEPYVNALNVIAQARRETLDQLFEMLKVSDLLRGTSEPTKTATANRLESQWSSLGLIVRQNQFAKFVGTAISKLGTVIAEKWSDEKILEAGDAETLFAPFLEEQPDPQAAYQELSKQVLSVLRNDSERIFKLQIASDSMVALDQRQERQESAELLQSAGSFFKEMTGIIEQYPSLATFSVSLFQSQIRRYKGGKELEGAFTVALEQVAQAAMQKQEAAANQPPDPSLQAKLQESQVRLQIAQMEAADKHEKNSIEIQKIQADNYFESLKQQNDAYMMQLEASLKARQVQFEEQRLQAQLVEIQMKANADAAVANVQEQIAAIDAILKQQEMQIKQNDSRMIQQEKLLEEKRLTTEANLKAIELSLRAKEMSQTLAIEQRKLEVSAETKAPPAPKKRKKRVGKIHDDGTFEIDTIEVD